MAAEVRSLADRGYTVRVLARSAQKAHGMLGEGVEVVAGDSTDRDHLRRALAECDAVHVSLPTESELAAVQHIVDLAASGAATELGRISYISGTSVRQENRWFDLIDLKMKAEEILRISGIPHTVFCPTWVMEVLPNFIKGRRAVIIQGKNPPAFHFFAAADLGRMVARSYEDDPALVHGSSFTAPRPSPCPRLSGPSSGPAIQSSRSRPSSSGRPGSWRSSRGGSRWSR